LLNPTSTNAGVKACPHRELLNPKPTNAGVKACPHRELLNPKPTNAGVKACPHRELLNPKPTNAGVKRETIQNGVFGFRFCFYERPTTDLTIFQKLSNLN
jgi:hypothetical protein